MAAAGQVVLTQHGVLHEPQRPTGKMLNADGRQGPCLHARDIGNRLGNHGLVKGRFDAVPRIRRQRRQRRVVAFGGVFG